MWLGMRQSGAWQQHEEGRGLVAPALLYALIHRSAWNRNSANFAFWGFSEVRIAPVQHLWTSQAEIGRLRALSDLPCASSGPGPIGERLWATHRLVRTLNNI